MDEKVIAQWNVDWPIRFFEVLCICDDTGSNHCLHYQSQVYRTTVSQGRD